MILRYDSNLKTFSRQLRSGMTDAEQLLWSRIRRKQILDVQFYRQKPIGNYIVDFYASAVKLIVEIDGSQHLEQRNIILDEERSAYLNSKDLHVLRFDNLQVLESIEAVVGVIYHEIERRVNLTRSNPS